MRHEIHRFLHDPADAGHPIEPAVQTSLGRTFGTELSVVRIHDDALAGRLTAEFGVDAFAYGRDIYFAAGHYRPNRPDGLRLLAHEVAHVLQQAAGQVPVDDQSGGGAAHRRLERAACRAADQVSCGRWAGPALRGVPVPAAVQRPVLQFHSSFEHRALGDMDVLDMPAATASPISWICTPGECSTHSG